MLLFQRTRDQNTAIINHYPTSRCIYCDPSNPQGYCPTTARNHSSTELDQQQEQVPAKSQGAIDR